MQRTSCPAGAELPVFDYGPQDVQITLAARRKNWTSLFSTLFVRNRGSAAPAAAPRAAWCLGLVVTRSGATQTPQLGEVRDRRMTGTGFGKLGREAVCPAKPGNGVWTLN